ncbi:MAG: tetratricopeptide repeat protein [Rhizomicrobium sp.]
MRASILGILAFAWLASIANAQDLPVRQPSHIVTGDPAPDGCTWQRIEFPEWSKVDLFCGNLDQPELAPAGFGVTTVAKALHGDAEAMRLLGQLYLARGDAKNAMAALSWFRKSAGAGDADAAYFLGLAYATGHWVPLDLKEAADWYRKAALLGQPEATHLLAEMLQSDRAPGLGVAGQSGVLPADDTEAARWLRAAAKMGDAGAMNMLAELLASGRGIVSDDAQAQYWFRAAAEHGYPSAVEALRARGLTPPPLLTVPPIAKPEAAFDIKACEALGPKMQVPSKQPQSEGEMFLWLLSGGAASMAQKGDTKWMMILGAQYLEGPPKLWPAGTCWLRAAGARGDDYDKFNVGETYFSFRAVTPGTIGYWSQSRNVPKDDVEAARWFFASASMGHEMAMAYLGDMYASGTGVPKDYVEAVRWYRMGTTARLQLRSAVSLAYMYAGGFGVPQNDIEAARLFEKERGGFGAVPSLAHSTRTAAPRRPTRRTRCGPSKPLRSPAMSKPCSYLASATSWGKT